MNVNGRVAVVTGGASGIGLALATRFTKAGAHVVLSDLDAEACHRHAESIGALPVVADVGREQDVESLVTAAIDRFGGIDLFVSNAGIAVDGGIETPTDKWQKILSVNLLAQVFAARYAVPHMLEHGGGYLLNVASAAGLLVIFDTVSYTVTNHAAIGLAEWLAATYVDQGIGVSVLCPAAVRTPILAGKDDTPEGRDAISTDEVADKYDAACEWGIPDHARLEALGAISVPVFVANGDCDPMILPRYSHLLAGLIPDATMRIYPDAAHGFLFQHHREFAADVEDFLR